MMVEVVLTWNGGRRQTPLAKWLTFNPDELSFGAARTTRSRSTREDPLQRGRDSSVSYHTHSNLPFRLDFVVSFFAACN